ncbi:HET-domain-containing protein [Pyrenochaeta sp. DS3sAY3a]|nr:HET-domain-containing protein [Pyrenochaeta sp. DS3sAY3a]
MLGQFLKAEEERRRQQLRGDVVTKSMASLSTMTTETASGVFSVLPPPPVQSSSGMGSIDPRFLPRRPRLSRLVPISSSPPDISGEESPRIVRKLSHRPATSSGRRASTQLQSQPPPALFPVMPRELPTALSFDETNGLQDAHATKPSTSSSDVYGRRHSSATSSRAASPKSTGSRSPPCTSSREFAKGNITPPTLQFEDSPPPLATGFGTRLIKSARSSTKASIGYKYTQIKSIQIRLLALRAGQGDELIHCSLKPIFLRELEKSHLGFFALSYSWGDDLTGAMIYVSDMQEDDDDSDTSKEFYIRSNLHSALKQLRRKDEDLWLWIDAICIDQSNPVEKSHQIPKMLDIYGSAWSVCIWLGETESVSRFDRASHDPLDFVSIIVNLKLLDRIVSGDLEEDTLASFVAFASLLKRPWFRRRWVIQEVAASKRAFVQCGEKKVNWVDFADAVELFLTNIERIRTIYCRSELARWNPSALDHVESWGSGAIVRAAHSVLKKSDWGKIVARLWDIESLVVTFLHYEATDSRDTVYALLSLAKDKDAYPGANPSFELQDQSYKKSTAQVYAEFVYHTIRSKNSLDIICRHWALPPSDASGLELPRWVGMATESPFGSSSKVTGRLNGDSMVGKPGLVIYNTSQDSRPDVQLYIHDSRQRLPEIESPRKMRFTNPGRQATFVTSAKQVPSTLSIYPQEVDAEAEEKARQRRQRRIERSRRLQKLVDSLGQNEDENLASDRSRANQNEIYAMPEEPETVYARHVASASFELGVIEAKEQLKNLYLSSTTGTKALGASQQNSAISHSSSEHSFPWDEGMDPSFVHRFPPITSITLCARGFRLCEITQASSPVLDGVITRESLKIAGWYRSLDINDIPDRLWRTLVADRTETGAMAPAWWRRACMHCLSRLNINGDLDTVKLINNEALPETAKQFLKRVQATVWNRKLFAASPVQHPDALKPMTLYGLGSRNIRKGDWCCVLLGCSVPVVLRQEEERPYFRFVGECYIDGMMDGQAMGFMKERGLELREFAMR